MIFVFVSFSFFIFECLVLFFSFIFIFSIGVPATPTHTTPSPTPQTTPYPTPQPAPATQINSNEIIFDMFEKDFFIFFNCLWCFLCRNSNMNWSNCCLFCCCFNRFTSRSSSRYVIIISPCFCLSSHKQTFCVFVFSLFKQIGRTRPLASTRTREKEATNLMSSVSS